ncbi:hypothetical protein, partial [Corynebacterium sp. HMSC06C06]|uniref:hypothetical protein n=1 Tax=Corynebacterium sp. HMSC06C06 TaxID=1581121 RepID=UPI001AEF792C
SSVRRAFSLTYALTYGKTYGETYVLAYALAGVAHIRLVTLFITQSPTPPLVRVLGVIAIQKAPTAGRLGLNA